MIYRNEFLSYFRDLYPEYRDSLQQFQLHLLEADELTPLRVWQVQDLSFQAGQRVISAAKEDAIQALTDISQNFPLMARFVFAFYLW